MKNMRAKDVQRFFEQVATDWDTMRLAYHDERVIEKMAEISGVGEDSEVADVGTGTGFVAAGIAPRVKRVVGVDNVPLCRRGVYGHACCPVTVIEQDLGKAASSRVAHDDRRSS
jgi:methylase of polypeptide subunit release factors